MTLRDVPYSEAMGKKFRREAWGWEDGPHYSQGYAFINEEGRVRYTSTEVREYTYGWADSDDWFEVDAEGYRVPDKTILIGGE